MKKRIEEKIKSPGTKWFVLAGGGALLFYGLTLGTSFLSSYLKNEWNLPKPVIVGIALLVAYTVGRPFAEYFGGRFERLDDILHRG